LQLAESLDVKIIEFGQPHPFFTAARVGPYEFVHVDRPPDRVTIEGSFFFVDAFRLRGDVTARARLFTDYIRSLLTLDVSVADPRVREEDLVLHFRAGDVFTGSHLHPEYGQPPLSFYLAAVEREKPARAWLVFEDRGNPCIDAVEAALRERGIEVMLQCATLAEDLRVLLSARRLVASRGTFTRMIASLSKRLQSVYFFHRGDAVELTDIEVFRACGVRAVSVEDSNGEFKDRVLAHWTGASEQQALMLTYPAENLAFVDGHQPERLVEWD
jgi:hypothetical protein